MICYPCGIRFRKCQQSNKKIPKTKGFGDFFIESQTNSGKCLNSKIQAQSADDGSYTVVPPGGNPVDHGGKQPCYSGENDCAAQSKLHNLLQTGESCHERQKTVGDRCEDRDAHIVPGGTGSNVVINKQNEQGNRGEVWNVEDRKNGCRDKGAHHHGDTQ